MRNKHYEIVLSDNNSYPESAMILMDILTIKHYTASVGAEFHPNYPTRDELDEYCSKCLTKLAKEGFTWKIERV